MDDIESKLKENQELSEEAFRMKVSTAICAKQSGLLSIIGAISLGADLAKNVSVTESATIPLFAVAGFCALASVLSCLRRKVVQKKINDNNEYIEAVKRDHEEALESISRSK